MPELPEVENARRLIAEHALGRPIADVDDTDRYVLRPHPPGELKAALTIEAAGASKSAAAAVEKAGGKLILPPKPAAEAPAKA